MLLQLQQRQVWINEFVLANNKQELLGRKKKQSRINLLVYKKNKSDGSKPESGLSCFSFSHNLAPPSDQTVGMQLWLGQQQ